MGGCGDSTAAGTFHLAGLVSKDTTTAIFEWFTVRLKNVNKTF